MSVDSSDDHYAKQKQHVFMSVCTITTVLLTHESPRGFHVQYTELSYLWTHGHYGCVLRINLKKGGSPAVKDKRGGE